jgi:phosphoenolpyruvate---glycerone phosphotransferase subunit DhaM
MLPMTTPLTANGFVALVLVSHSAAIADGLAELVAQVAGPDVPIVAAGGGPDGSFGTDGGRVLEALRGAATGSSGGVVLMDIGSAVLSVRAALEELGADAESITVVDAPLVEGAIAAGVTASTGGSREEVAAAAREARGAAKF